MSTLKETIYLRSPLGLQRFLVSIYGWWWYHRRFNSRFRRFVDELTERERWSAEQFRSYQEERLDRLIEHARNSAYYGELFEKNDISKSICPFEALSKMPLLTKESLRTAGKKLLTGAPPLRTTKFKSSGTTGTPVEIYFTSEFHSWNMALAEARCKYWAGVTYRDRRVMFGARKICAFENNSPPFWHFSPAENLAYASIYHLSDKYLLSYIEFLREFRPAFIEGYPSALSIVAQYSLENKLSLPPAKAVSTGSETLLDAARKTIEKAWQCKVFDRYGAVEGCMFVSQCEYGRYHVSPEAGIIEIVDTEGQPVEPGTSGEVVCTGLQNILQPLIRYKIGDVARWSAEQNCLCGRKMPVLEAIEGRVEDLCYTADGRRMLRFDTAFKGVFNIREAQVVQDSLQQYTVYVVPAAGFAKEAMSVIQRNMYSHVGKLKIDVKCVDTIPRSTSGKFRAVVCNLSDQEKNRIGGAGSGP
jgi:phenylacetate-CoA ligase